MLNLPIRIDGIYDERTLRHLTSIGVHSYGFDFRPLSPNFLQQHIFLELMKSYHAQNSKYYLCYHNEPDFIVEKMRDDFSQLIGKTAFDKSVLMVYTGDETLHYADKIGMPFNWVWNGEILNSDIIESSFLRGISINLSYLVEMEAGGALHLQLQRLIHYITSNIRVREVSISINKDVQDRIPSSVLDYLEIDFINVPINSDLEVCYRNVDLNKLNDQLVTVNTTLGKQIREQLHENPSN